MRSDIMGKLSARLFAALLVWVVVVLGNAQAQTSTSSISNKGSNKIVFARKIRNALLVNAAVLVALRAKENVWCPATMLTASTPEVVAAATVTWSIFSVRLARGRNTHPLLRVSLAVAQRPARRKQIAEKRVWSVARASALSRDARTWQARNVQAVQPS